MIFKAIQVLESFCVSGGAIPDIQNAQTPSCHSSSSLEWVLSVVGVIQVMNSLVLVVVS